jgi:hypothetical protein
MSERAARASERATLALALAAALGLFGGAYWYFFVRPETRPDTPPAEIETLVVVQLEGGVEVAGAEGRFRSAAPGTQLSIHDRIRTDDDGKVTLRGSDGATVRLSGATEARVDDLRRELKRLALRGGMIEADVPDDPARLFELSLDDQGGAARTRGAAFTASSNGKNTTVGARRGEVILSSHGREVVIRSGQLAYLQAGAPPEAPQPIPPSLFLKVDWPASPSRQKKLEVAGRTDPGARVQIQGKWVPVGSDGRYHEELNLSEGSHELHLRAADVGGHLVDEKSPKIVIDSRTDFTVHPPKWK